MATGSATPGAPPPPAGPPTQKITEIITAFRPTRHFKSSSPGHSITSLDFDDTGELMVVARDDDTLQIYSSTHGKHAKELASKKYGVHLARFSHHAQSIIYASTKVDDTIRFLSTHDNSYLRYFKGHKDTVTSIALCPSSDTFLSCAKDHTVRLWSLESPNEHGQLSLHGAHLATYDPSATVIAIASPSTHTVLLYDVRNFEKPPFAHFDLLELEQRFLGPQGGDWTKMEFTNDGKSLIVSTTGNGHFVLDAFSGDITHFCYRKTGHSGRVAPVAPSGTGVLGQGDVCTSPDGQYLVGGSGADGLLIWDISKPPTANHYLEATAITGPGKAAVIGYNPKFNMLAAADKDLTLWMPDPDVMMV